MPYEQTLVPVEKSQQEIKGILAQMDVEATRFTSFPAYTVLEFLRRTASGERLSYRITIQPKIDQVGAPVKAWDRAERQVWRVAYWWLKARFEAIQFGLVEFEQEFLPYMLMEDRDGRSRTTAELLWERLANRLPPSPEDPFGGIRLSLPAGRKE